MISTMIFPGRYNQGYGAFKRLGPEIARLGHLGSSYAAQPFMGNCCSDSTLTKVAEAVLPKDNPIYNEPIAVTKEMIIGAIKAADYEAGLRKRV